MSKVTSICKKILIVCVIILIMLFAIISCGQNEIESNNKDNKVAVEVQDASGDDYLEEMTRGWIYIVDSNGIANVYSFIDKDVECIGDNIEYVKTGLPYILWEDNDTEEQIIFAGPDGNGGWEILDDEFNSIPHGWRNYLESELDI